MGLAEMMKDEWPNGWSTKTLFARAQALGSEFGVVGGRDLTPLARYIAQHEQPPVDPDLIEAREIAGEVLTRLGASNDAIAGAEIKAGERDDAIVMHVALAAIKRGRELEARHDG